MSNAVARALRRRSIDVATVSESGLRGFSDEELLAYAYDAQRVVVTSDSDFLRLHHAGHQHAGIVYYEQANRSIGAIVTGLVLIAEVLNPDEMKMRIEFL